VAGPCASQSISMHQNLVPAKMLGIEVSTSALLRADQVIE
jgi:hypothetical protein